LSLPAALRRSITQPITLWCNMNRRRTIPRDLVILNQSKDPAMSSRGLLLKASLLYSLATERANSNSTYPGSSLETDHVMHASGEMSRVSLSMFLPSSLRCPCVEKSLKASPSGGAACDDIGSYSSFLLLCRVHKSRLAHSPSPTIVPDVAWLSLASMTSPCSCHTHHRSLATHGVISGAFAADTNLAGSESHLPQPQSWPSMAIIIGRNWTSASEEWPERLTRCIVMTATPMRDSETPVAFTMAPKMETGEAEAVPRVGSKWVRWVGCGKITAIGRSAFDQVGFLSIC
jgi:hypothetical protein